MVLDRGPGRPDFGYGGVTVLNFALQYTSKNTSLAKLQVTLLLTLLVQSLHSLLFFFFKTIIMRIIRCILRRRNNVAYFHLTRVLDTKLDSSKI